MALVRAIYDWSLDEGFTPQVMVDVTVPGVEIPADYAREGKIVLNIHPNAVRDLEIGDDHLLIGSDDGHQDPSFEPDLNGTIRGREDIPQRVAVKMFDDNAKRFYGIDGA